MKLPRYTQARTLGSGVVEYRFNPPQHLVDAGVVTRRQFGSDLRQVRKLVREDNQKIDIKQWAALVDCPADLSSAKKLIAGESWELIGVEVDLQVDTTPKFWKIINFSKGGTLQQAETSPPSNDVPF